MAKSFKFKNNIYLDSSSVIHNKQPLYSWLNELLKLFDCQKSIFTSNSNGVKIKINTEYSDKMAFLVLGADNSSGDPVVTVIKTHGNYKTLGYYREVKTNGTDWHIAVSQYSTVTVIAPRGANIELSNETL